MRGGPAWTRSVAGRVGLLIGLISLGVVGFGVVTVVSGMQALGAANRLTESLLPIERSTNLLLTAFVDEETGERGYVITGQRRFLQPFFAGEAEADSLTRTLRRKLRDDPAELRELALVEARHSSWLNETAYPEISEVSRGDASAAVAAERTGAGKAHFDAVRASIGALYRSVAGEEARSVVNLHERATITLWVAVAEGVVGLVLLAGSWLLLRRWVTDPIASLGRQVDLVAQGQLDREIEIGGLAEMSELGGNVELMRERLRSDSEELRHLRRALTASESLQQQLSRELAAVGASAALAVEGRILPAGGLLAGDWYDAWAIGENGIAVAVVDVSGHGATTGIFALRVKTLLTAGGSESLPPGEVLGLLARQLGDTEDRFVTGLLIHIDSESGRCSYANAGHPSGAVLGRDGVRLLLEPTGPLLGPMPGHWATRHFQLRPDETVLVCTDGVLEAHRHDGSEFGLDGVLQAVRLGRSGGEPREIVASVVQAVTRSCVVPLDDDATVFACRLGSAERRGRPSARHEEPAKSSATEW